MRVQVVAAIIRRDEKILITRRLQDVHLPGLWEFPGGKIEAGESFESALAREIREELGIEIRVGKEFFRVEHRYPQKTVSLYFFDCSIIDGEPQRIGVADLAWVRPAELSNFEFPEADRELIEVLRREGS